MNKMIKMKISYNNNKIFFNKFFIISEFLIQLLISRKNISFFIIIF
jgi:hypothetical protein